MAARNRVELLTPEGGLSPAFESVLQTLFRRFDVDGDGTLSEAELLAYSAAANPDGRQFGAEEIEELKDYFGWNNGLSLSGWLDMYHTQTSGDEVRKGSCAKSCSIVHYSIHLILSTAAAIWHVFVFHTCRLSMTPSEILLG